MSVFVAVLLSVTFVSTATARPELGSCKEIKVRDDAAPSGLYDLSLDKGKGKKLERVYCEMGLNGGGYTFLNPYHVSIMSDSELQEMVTDRRNVLMRVRMTNGTQPYAVLQQLNIFNDNFLNISLHNNVGYTEPVNVGKLGNEFLYFGFIPASKARAKTVQGIKTNGKELTFTNCDSNPNSYIALFPNHKERMASSYSFDIKWDMFLNLVASMRQNPSSRVMPEDFFMFLEMHHGGCGIYTQTDTRYSIGGVISAAIGFR